MFPLLLDLTGRLVVVVGGGAVGRRRAQGVRAAGGRVRLVCLESRPVGAEWREVDWRTEAYQAEHLHGASLVFAAASPAVNRQVVADARRLAVWVNCCDEPAAGDFQVPAVVRSGDFVLAVSTGGAAPALARRVRQRLAADFDAAFGQWVALLAELRPLVRHQVADPGRRRAVFEELSQWHWLERLRCQDVAEVRDAMWQRIAEMGER
jgi:precorrin-2 dehydrogenase/sirohydrochlorin ferrochelatase